MSGAAIRLVVFIVVEGLSPGPMERVSDVFESGLRRLHAEGAVFSRCHHEHAITENVPGSFALVSGRHPGPAGVGSDLAHPSYAEIGASALGDWLVLDDRRARVFSVAGRRETAVVLGGRAATGAYAFDARTGLFTRVGGSDPDAHPFLDVANGRLRLAGRRGARWERIVADTLLYENRARRDAYPGEADVSAPDASHAPSVFDHYLPSSGDVEALAAAFARFPFADEVTIGLAIAALEGEGLGTDDVPDFLAIGLSALDPTSHRAGPYSQEAIDVVLRLDRLLGRLFDALDEAAGSSYLAVLSSSHGMMPLPEYAVEVGLAGRRAHAEASAFVARVEARGRALGGSKSAFARVTPQGIWFDAGALRRSGGERVALEAIVREEAASESWIARVFSRTELFAGGDGGEDPLARRFRNAAHPARSPDVFVCPHPGVLTTPGALGTNHGTPHAYDTHVPLILMGPSVRPGRYDAPVATVDLAPTIARLLAIEGLPELDGRALEFALDLSAR